MERHFISKAYAALQERLSRMDLMRSGALTVLVLGCALLILGLGFKERGRGRLHKLTAQPRTDAEVNPPAPRPGGLEAVTLSRIPLQDGSYPEFVSMTLMPGLQMQVLQIIANIPGRGEMPILAAPTLDQAEKLTVPDPANAQQAIQTTPLADVGGIFLAPFPALSTISSGNATAENHIMPDGGDLSADYSPAAQGGQAASGISIHVNSQLSGRAIDLSMIARNTGVSAQPVSLGWLPHFQIANSDRQRIRLILPSSQMVSGSHVVNAAPAEDFSGKGNVLGSQDLNAVYVNLRHGFLSNPPVIEMQNPVADIGFRITMLASANAAAVQAFKDNNVIVVSPRSSVDGLAAREADMGTIKMLQPGETLQWKMRLEIFSLSHGTSGMMQ